MKWWKFVCVYFVFSWLSSWNDGSHFAMGVCVYSLLSHLLRHKSQVSCEAIEDTSIRMCSTALGIAKYITCIYKSLFSMVMNTKVLMPTHYICITIIIEIGLGLSSTAFKDVT